MVTIFVAAFTRLSSLHSGISKSSIRAWCDTGSQIQGFRSRYQIIEFWSSSCVHPTTQVFVSGTPCWIKNKKKSMKINKIIFHITVTSTNACFFLIKRGIIIVIKTPKHAKLLKGLKRTIEIHTRNITIISHPAIWKVWSIGGSCGVRQLMTNNFTISSSFSKVWTENKFISVRILNSFTAKSSQLKQKIPVTG